MKKLSLLLVVLLAAGSAGLYGQMAIGTNFSISGNATATVGYDLDDEQFGFKNEAKSNISIGLVFCQEEKAVDANADGMIGRGEKPVDANEDGMIGGKKGVCSTDNEAKVGMSGWVGSIELKDFKILIDSDSPDDGLDDSTPFVTSGALYDDEDDPRYTAPTATNLNGNKKEEKTARSGLYVVEPTIVAKLQNGPLYVQIYAAPANKAGLVAPVENDEDDTDPADDVESDDKDVELDLGGYGITFGYETVDLGIALGVTSDHSYDSDLERAGSKDTLDDAATLIVDETKVPKEGSFAVSVELDVVFGPALLELQVVQGIGVEGDTDLTKDDTGVAAKLSTKIGDVTLSAATDVVINGEEDKPGTDINESMDWEMGGSLGLTLTPNTKLTTDFIYSSKQSVASDVEVKLADKSGLVEDLKLNLAWGLFDLTNGAADSTDPLTNDAMDMYVSADLAYDLDAMGGVLTPGTKLTLSQVDGGDAVAGLEVRALLTGAVPATTFGAKWATDRLFDALDPGLPKKKGESTDASKGTLTLWTKIAY